MSQLLDSTTQHHLIEGVERLFEGRALHVDQNEIWLGLEPTECKTLLDHFAGSSVTQRSLPVHVVSSADPRALELRNRRVGMQPTLLVVLDERWDARSQRVVQSLTDLSRKLPSDLLREPADFPLEEEWLALAREEQREWIRSLFDVLRGKDYKVAIRDREGQPMRLKLGGYFAYLADTLREAGSSPEVALARGLHRLGLFTHPALATELRVKKGAGSGQALRERIASGLSQNYRAARDPEEFAANLASSQRTADKVLDDYLKKGGRLSSRTEDEPMAQETFRRFLRQETPEEALRIVEWEFHESTSVGVFEKRRGGRKKRFGVRGVLTDRDSLAEKRQLIVETFVQQASAGETEQTRQDVERLTDELGRGSTTEAARQELRNRAITLWKDAAESKALEQLLGWIDAIYRRTSKTRTEVIETDTLVGGLVEFGIWMRKMSEEPYQADWRIVYPQGVTQSVDPMSNEWRRNTHTLLRGAVRVSVENEPLELEEGEEPPDIVAVQLDVVAGKLRRQITLRSPRDWVQNDFRSKMGQPRQIFPETSAEPTRLQDVRPPRDLPSKVHHIADLTLQLADQLDPCGPCAIDLVREVVAEYERLLQDAGVGMGSAGGQSQRLAELQALLKALPKGHADRAPLLEEIADLTSDADPAQAVGMTDAELRAIARFQTLLPQCVERPGETADGPKVGWLMPLHPMCLRARVAADETALQVLAALMDHERKLSELQLSFLAGALERLEVLEPCRYLAPWSTGQKWPPLVFQEYDERHFAAFAPSRASQATYGRDMLVRVIRNYIELYPSARDRLVVYLEADEAGRLAYDLSMTLAFATEDGEETVDGIDLRLAGDENGHFPYLAEHAAARAGIDEALFGVARGRLKPRVMFRAADLASEAAPECHIAVVYAGRSRPGTTPLLEGRHAPHRELDITSVDPTSIRALVAPYPQQMHGAMLRVFSTRDCLDLAWERLQTRVHWQVTGSQFVTEVNLAPEQNGAALRALHSMADWVIILSELPIERAVEFDRDVVRLIDRRQFLDRGRDRHLVVSTSHSRVVEHLLSQEMERACGKRPETMTALLSFVRRFAPALAMRCVGSPEQMGPGGILGLLLTARLGETTIPGSVAIPLDEHSWIYGRGGLRADVLLLSPTADGAQIHILEAKYSKDGSEEVGRKAGRQVTKSAAAVQAWLDLTEISAYFRHRLHDIIMSHSAGSQTREALARRIVEGASLKMADTSEVHIWVWSGVAAAQMSTEANIRTVIHPTAETREALWALAMAPTE